jgi:hypothetical protein
MRLSAVAEERHQSADSPEQSTTDEPPQEETEAADDATAQDEYAERTERYR